MGEQKNQKTQDVNQLLKIRRDKLAELQADGKDPFQITKFDVTHHSQEVKDQFEDLEGKSVVLAGRMMSKRVMGKHLSAISRICRAISSLMWQETASVRKNTKLSKNGHRRYRRSGR